MKYFKIFEQIKNEEIFKKIRSEYFQSAVVDFSYAQSQGYKVTSDKVIFGTRLTYNADIEYLLHEMGHFVLFKDYSRLLKSEYGLNYPQVEINGQMYDQALSWTDIKNEIRAVIFQYILAKKYSMLLDLDGWIKSLRLLDGFTFVPVDGAEQKEDYIWYEKDGKEVPYNEHEKRKLITIKNFFDEEIKKERYNMKYFNTEWFNRVKFLENNLLSK